MEQVFRYSGPFFLGTNILKRFTEQITAPSLAAGLADDVRETSWAFSASLVPCTFSAQHFCDQDGLPGGVTTTPP